MFGNDLKFICYFRNFFIKNNFIIEKSICRSFYKLLCQEFFFLNKNKVFTIHEITKIPFSFK